MVPNASEITRRRLTAATFVRFFALLIALFGLFPIVAFAVHLAEGRVDWSDFEDWGGFTVAAVILYAASATVWAFAPWVSRLMIRVPRVPICPNCRYKLEHLASPQCTECGYTLTPEFLTTATERAASVREPDTIWLRQISTLVMRLVSGVLLPIGAIGCFVTASEAIRRQRWQDWTLVYIWGFVTLVALGVVLFASWLSIHFVPGRRRFERRANADAATPERLEAGSLQASADG